MLLAAPKPGPRSGVEAADHLVGRSGVATTDLRPSGTARFGDERRSVVADGPAIEAGQAIVVTAVEGYRIVVRAEESSAARSTSR
jgi:membrane-bound serine protease (ClpP class)